MQNLELLLKKNREWAAQMLEHEPLFFQTLAKQQSPDYLWIGCADSRVPATQLVGLLPGEMFVHRNVANVVVHSDLNCLSVLHFAIDVLKVEHVIVCGHYGCGGVQAALQNSKLGLIDNWLRHIQDVRNKHEPLLSAITDQAQRFRRLCELNVIEQVVNVCQTTIVQQAWEREQPLSVHGLIYDLNDGLLRDLNMQLRRYDELTERYRCAIAALS